MSKVIYIYLSILFQILFPFRLLQSVEQSSLCYTLGPWLSSILSVVVYTRPSQTPSLSPPPPFPPGNHSFVFCVCESVSVFSISSFVSYFKILHISNIIYLSFAAWQFTQHGDLQAHPCCCRWHYFILFYGWVMFHCITFHYIRFYDIFPYVDIYT